MPLPSVLTLARRAACGAALFAAPLVGRTPAAGAQPPAPAPAAAPAAGLRVPVEYYKLPNGLRVVLSRDTAAPTAVVAVYYNIGFRNEPRDRTGFAHLFEHLMFQGSRNLGKMEFIKLVQQNGGVLNGSTRFDFTNYFQVVPSHVLETILWAEADRMRGLAIDGTSLRNQQDVVKSEVRVNVLNQPYGGFPWIDLPMTANTNWHNAHNFYGDLRDLDAATLAEARQFFSRYYVPNNAALVVVGDFDPAAARGWVAKYFGTIARGATPAQPDLTEPRQTLARRATRADTLATRPALGWAYHVPPRNTPEWYAFGLLDQLMAQGKDSRLYDELVRRRKLVGDLSAGINYGLGGQFDYSGPMLWIASAFHDADVPADTIVSAVDAVVADLQARPVDRATLDRAVTKMRAALYDEVESFQGFGRANLLASFALFDDDPARVNRLEAEFARVTPELLQRTAREYLRPTNRTVYTVTPAARAGAAAATTRSPGR
jgi:predicted Zn-dependent peptidase